MFALLDQNARVRSRFVDVNFLVWWLRSSPPCARPRVRTPHCLLELLAHSKNPEVTGSIPRGRNFFFNFFIFAYVHAWLETP
jgi:hypothetical protein